LNCGENEFDPDIRGVWSAMLKEVAPDEYASNPPDFNAWQRAYKFGIDTIAEEGDRLIPLARHVAMGLKLVYPREDEVESQYIEALATPEGRMGYEQLFERAIRNVELQSNGIALAILGVTKKELLASNGQWDLDTGRIDGGPRVYWKEAVA
jgi:hypothetical protein